LTLVSGDFGLTIIVSILCALIGCSQPRGMHQSGKWSIGSQ
jgi:hypothetical protein